MFRKKKTLLQSGSSESKIKCSHTTFRSLRRIMDRLLGRIDTLKCIAWPPLKRVDTMAFGPTGISKESCAISWKHRWFFFFLKPTFSVPRDRHKSRQKTGTDSRSDREVSYETVESCSALSDERVTSADFRRVWKPTDDDSENRQYRPGTFNRKH